MPPTFEPQKKQTQAKPPTQTAARPKIAPSTAAAQAWTQWMIRAAAISQSELVRAQAEAKKDRVPDKDAGHNDIYDAERHARWMYRLTREISQWAGEAIGYLKEMWGVLKGAGSGETAMDFHNNEVGRQAALKGKPIPSRHETGELIYLDPISGKPLSNAVRLRAERRGQITAEAAKGGAAARKKMSADEKRREGLTDRSGDSSQWTQEKKIASLAPSFQPKVERIIARLTEAGFRPKIVFGWRSTEVQKELVKQRKSTVSFSFHNAQRPDGTPGAWAVDLVDARWGWTTPACMEFFKALGAEAKAEGLVWGGDWKGFPDWAHIQDRKNSELKQVKIESGL